MSDTHEHATSDSNSTSYGSTSRRSFMKAAGVGVGGLALGGGFAGSASGTHLIPTPQLETDGNVFVDPEGNTVTLRGVNIIEPRRADTLAPVRGKNAVQMVDQVTGEGWYPDVVRVPLQPSDIAKEATGYAAGPLPPGEFTQSDLQTYLEDHVDPVVDRCEDVGVYCILDYHRHWTADSAQGERGFDGYWTTDTDNPTVDNIHEGLQQEMLDFWDVVASEYGDRSHTLFELYNEPTKPGMWGDPTETGWVGDRWPPFVELMQPVIDQVEAHSSNPQLLGNPSWTQSPEGILLTADTVSCYDCDFQQFDEPENLAMTYHIYPAHTASKNNDWEDVSQDNNGEGTMGVEEEYPLFVTEFGWDWSLDPGRNEGRDDHYPLQGTAEDFMEPLYDQLLSKDSVSWTAWCADIWWDTTMFERGEEGWEQQSDTEIENPYTADIPNDCPSTPCEWQLKGRDGDDPYEEGGDPYNEFMGQYIKDTLAELRNDNNPAGQAPEHGDGGGACEDVPTETVDGQTVCDVDGDSLFEDVNGDGDLGQDDVVTFFENQHRSAWQQPELFDFSENGSVGHGDVVALFEEVAV